MPLPSLLKSLPLISGKLNKVRDPEEKIVCFLQWFQLLEIGKLQKLTYLLHGRDQYSAIMSYVSSFAFIAL